MRIQNNVLALNSWRNLNQTSNLLGKSLERLSSGYRISKAADDAAGLAISEKMRGQIRGLNQAVRNAQDGISLIQTAEGALNETHAILQRMRELAVQAANDTATDADRMNIQDEITQLIEELDRIAENTEFNTQTLMGASEQFAGKKFLIGANSGQSIDIDLNAMDSASLGVDGIDVTDQVGADGAITTIDTAIATVSAERSKLGAIQNRLEHTINNLSTAAENLQAAESRIRDIDMAKEMMEFTKNNILLQAGTAMLAQANQVPQQVLQLLR
ncbi:MAG TPA: flagellin [Firmicutes bacterium]|nr:flagellin [Bacillota bacterium]